MDKRIEKIANHYGLERQIVKLCEECGELTTAVAKYINADNDVLRNALLDNVISEMADVTVMIEQIKHLLGVGERVQNMAEYKIARQIGRISANKQAEVKND